MPTGLRSFTPGIALPTTFRHLASIASSVVFGEQLGEGVALVKDTRNMFCKSRKGLLLNLWRRRYPGGRADSDEVTDQQGGCYVHHVLSLHLIAFNIDLRRENGSSQSILFRNVAQTDF